MLLKREGGDGAVNLLRACSAVFLWAAPAAAHSWYDSRCCSGRDCHPVPCEQLQMGADGGVTFRPTNLYFFKENVLPSQDARCHICTSQPDKNAGYGYCAYIVQGF